MQLKHNYFYFKEALSPEICEKIINLGKSKVIDSAVTYGDQHKQAKPKALSQNDKTVEELKEEGMDVENTYIRDSDISWINDSWLYDLIFPYVRTANESAGWKYDFDCAENFQFTIYNKSGFYGWHSDGMSDHNAVYKRYVPGISPTKENGEKELGYVDDERMIGKIRKLSVTINLTNPNDYEGGNLKFDFGPHSTIKRFHLCEEIRPQGSIIIFPSFVHHQVTPVTRGTRYSLVLWCLGKPFR